MGRVGAVTDCESVWWAIKAAWLATLIVSTLFSAFMAGRYAERVWRR
jgi:hypothetical protein